MKHHHRITRRRVIRSPYGVVCRIAPRETGALAQCRFCQWGKFFRDNDRLRYSAMARAAASLREHTKIEHTDKLPKLWIPPNEEEKNDGR
jgi:hypothetical protein